jgi:ubiquitin C-terminal hydrolase
LLKRPSKTPRISNLASVTTSDMPKVAPTSAQRSSNPLEGPNDYCGLVARSAKRKLERQGAPSNPIPPKRIRRSIDAGIDGSKRLLPGCRGGKTRQRRVVDSDDENEDDQIDPEQNSAAPTEDPAAQTSESHHDGDSSAKEPAKDTSSSVKEDNSSGLMSSPCKTVNDTEGSTSSTSSDNSSEPSSSLRKTVSEIDSSTESTKESASSTISSDNYSGPANSPHKTVNNTDGNTDGTNESAASSEDDSDDLSSDTPTQKESGLVASEESSDTKSSAGASKESTRSTAELPRQIRGLVNNSNQCFANSVIQLFDAAMDGHDLDLVLGQVEDIETADFKEPKLTPEDVFELLVDKSRANAKTGAKKSVSKLRQLQTKIRACIAKLRRSGKRKYLSPRKHLRALLHRLRQVKGKGQSESVTPFVFQQILAFGDENASREELSGETQEDCLEYFQALLVGLKSETAMKSQDGESAEQVVLINDLFEIETEVASLCSNDSCDYKGSVTSATSNAHTVHVAQTKTKAAATVEDLLNESNISALDTDCPKCREQMLERVDEITQVSDNFVLHINRVGADYATKIKKPFKLPLQPIELCGKEFLLNAVVKHRGESIDMGHYTVLRRRNPSWMTEDDSPWYLFDDHKVSAKTEKDVKDTGRSGQSMLLLFKAA